MLDDSGLQCKDSGFLFIVSGQFSSGLHRSPRVISFGHAGRYLVPFQMLLNILHDLQHELQEEMDI